MAIATRDKQSRAVIAGARSWRPVAGQPEPRDRQRLARLLCAATGNAEPPQGADATDRRGARATSTRYGVKASALSNLSRIVAPFNARAPVHVCRGGAVTLSGLYPDDHRGGAAL